VLTNFDHNRQWFNTLIPPSLESAAVTVDCISRLSEPVKLILHCTTVDIHCKNRQYEKDGGIIHITIARVYDKHASIQNHNIIKKEKSHK